MAVEITAAVQAVWERSREKIAGQIGTLEEAIGALIDDRLDEDLRARAESNAHQLAGSLGMFGIPRGSELARELEQALVAPTPSEASHLTELALALSAEVESGPAASDAK